MSALGDILREWTRDVRRGLGRDDSSGEAHGSERSGEARGSERAATGAATAKRRRTGWGECWTRLEREERPRSEFREVQVPPSVLKGVEGEELKVKPRQLAFPLFSSASTDAAASRMAPRAPPPPRGPWISLDFADAPTQRLYLVSAFLLLQSAKVPDLVFPSDLPLPDVLDINSRLVKWLLVDLAAVAVIHKLRVPRFTWGWRGTTLVAATLVLLDWLLFGRWKVSSPIISLSLPFRRGGWSGRQTVNGHRAEGGGLSDA